MKIYIDNDFKCYTTAAENRREVEIDFFEDKCAAFIEGHRYVPAGETWTRPDGEVFKGEMLSPWRDIALLDEFQAQYEEAEAAHLEELGALVDEIYTNDLEVIG